MEKTGQAYFVKYPRIIDDLNVIHDVVDESPYEIVKEIRLQPIDFENFATDMTVERQFIEDNAGLCADGAVKKCLFVYMRGGRTGILVLPDPHDKDYVGWAALLREA